MAPTTSASRSATDCAPARIADANDARAVRELDTLGELTVHRLGARLPGDDRGAWVTSPSTEIKENVDRADRGLQATRRSTPSAPDHRRRSGIRPHHLGDRRGHDRVVRHGDAVLRHAQGAPRPARHRQDVKQGLIAYQDRGPRRRPRQGPPPMAREWDDALSKARFEFRWRGPVQPVPRSRDRARRTTTRRCPPRAPRSPTFARCAVRSSARWRSPSRFATTHAAKGWKRPRRWKPACRRSPRSFGESGSEIYVKR